jgi:hypothetical protein
MLGLTTTDDTKRNLGTHVFFPFHSDLVFNSFSLMWKFMILIDLLTE